jgi:HEPN domain-containing protein
MKPATRQWLELADADLRAAATLSADASLTAAAAFHCQQAVEKAFKAIMEEKGVPLVKTHDLGRLLGIIQQVAVIDVDEDRLDILNQVYVSSRYPADLGMLPGGQPSSAEVQEMHAFARGIVQRVTTLLGGQ